MSQVIIPGGILLGNGVYIFQGAGDPNSRTDELLTSVNGATDSVSLGSLYIDRSAPALYQKTGAISVSAPAGTWTQIS